MILHVGMPECCLLTSFTYLYISSFTTNVAPLIEKFIYVFMIGECDNFVFVFYLFTSFVPLNLNIILY